MTRKKKGSGLTARQKLMRTRDYEWNYCMTAPTRCGIEYRLSWIFDVLSGYSDWDSYEIRIEDRWVQPHPDTSQIKFRKWCLVVYKITPHYKKETHTVQLRSKWYFDAVKEALSWVEENKGTIFITEKKS